MSVLSIFNRKSYKGRGGRKLRRPEPTRKFEGKRFMLVPVSSSRKRDMEEKADEYRRKGYMARLVYSEGHGQWFLYVRR